MNMSNVNINEIIDNAKFNPFHWKVLIWCLLIIIFDGYDLVIYSGEGCVDNEPEYLIADPRQVTVKNIIIENIQLEYLDELETSWREKKTYSTKRPKFK